MSDPAKLLVDNLDVWVEAVERKNNAGRGDGGKLSLCGIQKLRSLVIDLAIHGKLVPQDPSDEPASKLLSRAKKTMSDAITHKKMRTPKAPEFDPSELDVLPPRWVWTRLIDIAQINPRNDADENIEASFVPMPLVSGRVDGAHDTETRRWGDIRSGYTHFADGDIALAKITPCFENGKAAVFARLMNGIGAGTTELHIARPLLDDFDRRYLLLTLKTSRYLADGEVNMTGTAGQKRVPRGYFELTPFPLPPLAEQKRIVAKVDELMELVDALESGTREVMAAHETLVRELLATLVNSQNADDLPENWSRIERHFDTLFTTEGSIESLRQAVFDLAIRGMLVPQFKTDEPSAIQFKRLGVRKSELGFNSPFVAPVGWEWTTFGEYADEISTGPFGTMVHKEDYVEDGIPIINPSHMIGDRIIEDPSISLPKDKAEALASYKLQTGDIVFARRGEVGRLAIVTERENGWLCGTGSFRARFTDNSIQPYLLVFFRSQFARKFLSGVSVGATMSNLNQRTLSSLPVPVPPQCEQDRIVAKVKQLLILCEAIQRKIKNQLEIQCRLTESIVIETIN